jgi:hypothetical protein
VRKDQIAVLQCCGHAVLQSERGRSRLEAEGEMSNVKAQMTNGNELVGSISLIGFIGQKWKDKQDPPRRSAVGRIRS